MRLLIVTGNPWLFGALICYVLLCYGGGFGTMPSFILDVFGTRKMAHAYGVSLTAWSAGGIIGPQIFAFLKVNYAEHAATYSFLVAAGFVAVGLLLSLGLSRTRRLRSSPANSRRQIASTLSLACRMPCPRLSWACFPEKAAAWPRKRGHGTRSRYS